VDVLASTLDMLYINGFTEREIMNTLKVKLAKWKGKVNER